MVTLQCTGQISVIKPTHGWKICITFASDAKAHKSKQTLLCDAMFFLSYFYGITNDGGNQYHKLGVDILALLELCSTKFSVLHIIFNDAYSTTKIAQISSTAVQH